MAVGLRGRFLFKKIGERSLSGVYSNDTSLGIYSENCDFVSPLSGEGHSAINFIGIYDTNWTEEDGQRHQCRLVIRSVPRGGSQLVELEWLRNQRLWFRGEAMVIDGVLVGDYTQVS